MVWGEIGDKKETKWADAYIHVSPIIKAPGTRIWIDVPTKQYTIIELISSTHLQRYSVS